MLCLGQDSLVSEQAGSRAECSGEESASWTPLAFETPSLAPLNYLWPHNPEVFSDGAGWATQLPLEKGESQAREVSPETMVIVRLSLKVDKARFWPAVSAEDARSRGRW